MDRQITNIPVNTRPVGDAEHISEGIYVLYLEDYVHTFVKKMVYGQKNDILSGISVFMYGSSFERSSQSILVVSGAAACEYAEDSCFSSDTALCTALVTLNKEKGIRFELSIKGTKVILDDYYIYYDQNEQMQNYLIEWNRRKHEYENFKPQKHSGTGRAADNAARLGRVVQAYNRETARVSLVWGAVNVLGLSLVVCIVVYGIISMNSYGKMQSMQENIDYCMAFLTENFEKTTVADRSIENGATVEVMNDIKEQQTEEYTEDTVYNLETSAGEMIFTETALQETEAVETDTASLETSENNGIEQPEAMEMPENTTVPQYYVVRRGDTLRNICISVYGDYSKIDEVCKLNGLDNPDSILYGQKLLLP